MAVTKDILIQHFCSRYLNSEDAKNVTKISDILELPLTSFKDSKKSDLDILEKNQIKTIRDLSKLSADQIQTIIKTTQINEVNLENFYIASQLIARAWQKRSSYKEKESTKVCVIGLDNAGKSTIIDLLSGKRLSEAVNQEPTTEVERITVSSEVLDIILWDFAGQVDFRQRYVENPEQYFLQIDLVMFVIDVQDKERYDEALIYLKRILDTIKFLGESPYFIMLFHKYDPELKNNPEFEISINYLKEKIADSMKASNLAYEIINSSIYSALQNQPKIVNILKDTFRNEKDNPNLLLVDILVKLTENLFNIGERILQGQERIIQLISQGKLPQLWKGQELPSEGIEEIEFVKPSQIAKAAASTEVDNEVGPGRKSILNELKQMFANTGLSSAKKE